MSSWRNAVKDKVHKERSQPMARQSLGILEKKKDYKLRAEEQHKKKKVLQEMKLQASLRNPDEFNTRMITLKREKSDQKEENEKYISEKEKDAHLLNGKRVEKERKIERLVASLQFMDNEESNHHTIFVDNPEEMQNWDAATYFDTLPQLVDRKYNRLSEKQLRDQSFASSLSDEKQLSKMKERREKRYKELEENLDDQVTIDRVMSHIELRKNLNRKGRRVKVSDGENGFAAVYRWKYQRKK